MKKSVLLEFIKKYSLNGTIEKCRWISDTKAKTLKVDVANDTKNLLVSVVLANWDGIEESELGIGDTKQVKTALGALCDEDITSVLNQSDDKDRIISIDFVDNGTTRTVITSDLDALPKSASMKTLPPMNAEIIFDAELKERFLKAKASLPDVESLTVLMNKKNVLEMMIGFSNINSNRASVKVKTVSGKDTVTSPIHFRADHLKEILSANSESGDTTLYVSDDGLATISFVSGDFTCKYYMMSLDQD
jgi:hypothetical protein